MVSLVSAQKQQIFSFFEIVTSKIDDAHWTASRCNIFGILKGI